MGSSIFSRKRDLVYLVYFCIHIPVMLLVDLSSLYPPQYTPAASLALKKYLVTTYQDQFFVKPPPFFLCFMWMEVFFHLPVSSWSIYGLLQDDPKVPLVLLVYGLQTLLTTATCMWDYSAWTTVSFETKLGLSTLYGPYLALALFMTVDMYVRLNAVINGSSTSKGTAQRVKAAGRAKKEL